MKVCKSPLPENSRIVRYPDANYRDCFRCRLQNPGKVSPNQVMAAFWTTSPAWLKFLFRLRDLLVRPFGLKTGEGPSREKLEEALNNGESCGFMSVAERTADETIVALDDKHLVAYMSIYIEGGEVFGRQDRGQGTGRVNAVLLDHRRDGGLIVLIGDLDPDVRGAGEGRQGLTPPP